MYRALYAIITCTILCGCAASRGKVNVFAYRQPALQGVAPVVISNEHGQPVPPQVMKERANYFIYVESPTRNIEIKELWIRGIYYKVRTDSVASPVLAVTSPIPKSAPDTLVQRTSNKLLQVWITADTPAEKPSPKIQKKIGGNELVIHYIMDGKDYYYTARTIKNLPPVALQ